MLFKTHIAIVTCFILLFIPHVESKIVFVIVALVAAAIPDVDNASSTVGEHRVFRFLQFFAKHRGAIHSLTVGLVISLLLAFFLPVASFGFFLGWTVHVFADSFTKGGVTPFWPYPKKSYGFLPVGGRIETTLFVVFVIIDIGLLVWAFI